MGYPPPPDLPPVAEQNAASVSIGMPPSPTGPALCGFGFPSFAYSFAFRIPAFPPFPFPPTFNYFIQLKCDLSNPIDADFSFGGGREPNAPPDVDEEYPD